MASTCITISYGATSINLRGADYNDTRSVQRVQARSRTHDGTLLVGDRELTILRFILTWNALTDAERALLEDFFGPTKVNGSLNSFTYIDENSVSYTVRLISDPLEYVNGFDDFWGVDMIFEVIDEDAGS